MPTPGTRTGGSGGSTARERLTGSDDQVPGVQAPPGPRPDRPGRRHPAPAPASTCSAAPPGWPRRGSGWASTMTAVDSARFAHVLARCYVATDPGTAARPVGRLSAAVERLDALPGAPGYVTATFCEQARYFRPENGARIDAIRDAIEREYAGSDLWPVLVTSLLEAADRVDSTTGLQMAYLKQWAPRSHRPLALRVPELLAGPGPGRPGRRLHAGRVGRGWATWTWPTSTPPTTSTATTPTTTCGRPSWPGTPPPTTAWRPSARTCGTRPPAAPSTGAGPCPRRWAGSSPTVRAEVLILSYNNESWLSFDELRDLCCGPGPRRGAGLRLGPLRRGEDRHPRPVGSQGGHRLPRPQHRVRAGGGRPGPGPAAWCGRSRRRSRGPGRRPGPCRSPRSASGARFRFDPGVGPLPT